MSESPQIQSYHPQANPHSYFGIAYGTDRTFSAEDIAQAEVAPVVIADSVAQADLSLYWRQRLRVKALPKLASPELSEYLLTQFGIYHATSLGQILDEAVYYPRVKTRIMSILAPHIEATQALDSDKLPTTPTGVISSNAADETAEPEVTDVRNMSLFRFLNELEDRTYKPDEMEDEE